MNYKSLQAKIVIIFSIPMFALIYFSSSFVTTEYEQLEKSKANLLCANTTQALTELIHSTQIERGLSAGYIVVHNEKLKQKLLLQYKKTDEKLQQFQKIIKSKNSEINRANSYLPHQDKEYLLVISNIFSELPALRAAIIKQEFLLQDELKYYINLNTKLINLVDIYINFLNFSSYKSDSIIILQKLKEVVGVQRAYIYTNILKKNCSVISIENIKTIQLQEDFYEEKFNRYAQKSFSSIYKETLDQEIIKQLQEFKRKLFNEELTASDANQWFETSSKYISQLQTMSKKLIEIYVQDATHLEKQATTALYITGILWIGSILAYFFLLFLLKLLIKQEKKMLKELRISSYMFDSHEAMILTSTRGKILQVNAAFTEITGYTEQEALGKSTNMLKSFKHSQKFYKQMWQTLSTQGKWSDEIYNKRKNGEIYLERLSITAIKDDEGKTINYIAQFLDISDLKNAQEIAEHQADHDFLTSILNRKALTSRLNEEFSKAKRHQLTHAFLFIDLDNFKAVNDNFGHAIGDKVLIEVTLRIRALLREEDILSRMSGDEFAVILLNMDSKRPTAALQVKEKCNKIIQELSKEFIFNEYKIHIGASIGVKIFPNYENSVQDVVIHADTAMYQAKHEGKNRYVFFDQSIERRLKELAILEDELRLAIQNKEFIFYLQPKVDIARNRICGAEALVRWKHPTKGLLYPGSFLDAASSIDLLPQITKLALESVCSFLKKNATVFNGIISININAFELLSPAFESQITAIIKSFDVDPSQIELEILENDLIEDIEMAIKKINSLKALGFKLSIDDFGTGYSSITYLKRLPVHHLKLDRHFTQNFHDDSNKELIKLMINMAKVFNMKTVVEGVETAEQLEYIQVCGADMYQGFYCSPAVEEAKFIKLLSQD